MAKTTFQTDVGFSTGAEGGSGCFSVYSGTLLPLLSEESLKNNDLSEKARVQKRHNRFALMHLLAKKVWEGKTPPHQVRFCSRKAVPAKTKKKDGSYVPTGMPGEVQIHRYGDIEKNERLKHGYYGMYHCSSAMICPVCGPVIQARRAQEVVQAGMQLLKYGYQIGMITQTASHTAKTSLYDFVQRFQAAQHDMRTWREFRKWQAATGAKFTIRSVETTDDRPDFEGRKTGWHFHSHTLMFFDRTKAFTDAEAKEYTASFQKMWVKALKGVGLSGSLERAATFSLPRATKLLEDAREESVDVSKDNNVARLCQYVAKAFSYEISSGSVKKGRDGDRRISVWQLQEMALTTHPKLLPRYCSYMVAVKGLSWLRWSAGLKDFCKISEVSDEDIMKGEEGELIYSLTGTELKRLANHAFQSRLIEIADGAQERAPDAIAQAFDCLMRGVDPVTGEVLNE